MSRKKWMSDGEEQRILEDLFKTGQVLGSEPAEAVYRMSPEFMEFKFDTFKQHYYQTLTAWRNKIYTVAILSICKL